VQLHEGGRASIFGAPISAALNSSTDLVHRLGGSVPTVKIVAVTMIVLMGASTFWTQRQMMARAGAAVDKQQQQVQKFMLYVLPFSFAIFGFSFPIGVLLYWLTTNVWSMGQQHYVIKRMPPVVPGSAGAGKGGAGGAGPGSGPAKVAPSGGGVAGPGAAEARAAVLTATTAGKASAASRPPARRAAGSRKNKKRGRR
jgi:YidC/Oxa1 family membrane protein insertase